MSCFRTALDFEVINGSCCEHEAVKCASKGFTSCTYGFIILLPKFLAYGKVNRLNRSSYASGHGHHTVICFILNSI